MGYGEIIGGGAAGRYTLRLDYGEGVKTATLDALNEQIIKLDADIAAAQVRLTQAEAAAAEARAAVADATNAFITAGGTGNLTDLAVQAALTFLEEQRKFLIEAQKLTIDPRLKLDALRVARAQVLDLIARWTAAVVAETKQVWCTDLTEDGAGGVATIDIDNDSPLTLIAPGCRGWTQADGQMRATDVMSPEQCYWNLAALPGVQKFKPTYRWGTLTALDKDANTATVSLNAATSSQQSLGINQSTTLTGIPVVYMTCNARAFEVNDRVVVQFLGQDWANPRVIGFLDNPRPCVQYVASYYVIGYGPLSSGNLHLFDTLERGEDELWGNFSTVTPVAPWKFIQWSDGVTSLMRNDGTATESISRTARYTYAPNFRVTYTWTVEAYATSGTYFDGSNFVKDWEVKVTGSVAWSAIGYATPPTSPASAAIDSVVWSGQALDSIGPDQVMFNLTDTYLGETSPGGPIYFPAYPSSSTQTAVFVLAGSANQYSVVGNAGTNPFPGGVIPSSASGTGAVTTIDYTATSWSAVYA
jgi:hypothetical protein